MEDVVFVSVHTTVLKIVKDQKLKESTSWETNRPKFFWELKQSVVVLISELWLWLLTIRQPKMDNSTVQVLTFTESEELEDTLMRVSHWPSLMMTSSSNWPKISRRLSFYLWKANSKSLMRHWTVHWKTKRSPKTQNSDTKTNDLNLLWIISIKLLEGLH